jgi:hypothetical protein
MSSKSKKQTKPTKRVAKPKANAKGTANADRMSLKTPAWYSFTKLSTDFVSVASRLSNRLKAVYGDSCSIGFFSKFLGELPALTPDQRSLIYLDKECVDLYTEYLGARDSRDAERQSFRGAKEVQSIASGLDQAKEMLTDV